MRKLTTIKQRMSMLVLTSLCLAAITYAASSINSGPEYDANYANDRAQIEDLLARYAFALDWRDADRYAATFTEDGVLDWAQGIVTGRAAIHAEMLNARQYFADLADSDQPLRAARLRHFISNKVISVNKDTAEVRSMWFEIYNNNPQRSSDVQGYGHTVDQLKKINGQWLFSKRTIYNEEMDHRFASEDYPAW